MFYLILLLFNGELCLKGKGLSLKYTLEFFVQSMLFYTFLYINIAPCHHSVSLPDDDVLSCTYYVSDIGPQKIILELEENGIFAVRGPQFCPITISNKIRDYEPFAIKNIFLFFFIFKRNSSG